MRIKLRGSSTFPTAEGMVDTIINTIAKIPELGKDELIFKIKLALRELLNNAVEHGNGMDSQKNIICEFFYEQGGIILKVTDEGDGFDICRVFRGNVSAAIDRDRFRGILIIKNLGFILSVVGNQVTARFTTRHEDWKERV